MIKISLAYEESTICPECEAILYQEVWEDEKKLYLVCEQDGCDYERLISYENIKFTFTYRDEFTTDVMARNIEEAMEKIDDVNWKRTSSSLWKDYLQAEYFPFCE
jgi:uncharacterized pyridoxamine 5'-phosphate oxidase family protein